MMTQISSNILLVEDDRDSRITLETILTDQGYSVETTETGAQALEKSREKKFDLALIDIKLPDMEGTKLLHGLKDQSEMRKIMITVYATLANAIDSLNFGAHAYLLKPVLPDFLLKVIEEQLLKQQQ